MSTRPRRPLVNRRWIGSRYRHPMPKHRHTAQAVRRRSAWALWLLWQAARLSSAQRLLPRSTSGWLRCLRRRSQKSRRMGWSEFETLTARFRLPVPPSLALGHRRGYDADYPREEPGCGVCCRCTRKGVCSEQLTVGISCAKDEGGPLGIGFQEQVPNQSKLLRSKGVVVSVGSKVRMKFGQVSIRETSVSKPSVTRRKALDTAKTRGARILWDKSVGYLVTGQIAVGV